MGRQEARVRGGRTHSPEGGWTAPQPPSPPPPSRGQRFSRKWIKLGAHVRRREQDGTPGEAPLPPSHTCRAGSCPLGLRGCAAAVIAAGRTAALGSGRPPAPVPVLPERGAAWRCVLEGCRPWVHVGGRPHLGALPGGRPLPPLPGSSALGAGPGSGRRPGGVRRAVAWTCPRPRATLHPRDKPEHSL